MAADSSQTPKTLHVLYERVLHGGALVLDGSGRLTGALGPEELRHFMSSGQADLGGGPYKLLDPSLKRRFCERWEVRAIDDFNRYFLRTFRDRSPVMDSRVSFLDNLAGGFDRRQSSGRLLDLGAGHCGYAKFWSGPVVMIDLIPPVSGTISGTQSASYVVASGSDLPFEDESFSVVACLFMLEHVADPFSVLDEAYRVLRPGGTLVLAVPSHSLLALLSARLLGFRLFLPIQHLRSFGPFRFRFVESTPVVVRHLRRSGFSQVRVRSLPASARWYSRVVEPFRALVPLCYSGAQVIIQASK